jgi:hypothetical protein
MQNGSETFCIELPLAHKLINCIYNYIVDLYLCNIAFKNSVKVKNCKYLIAR